MSKNGRTSCWLLSYVSLNIDLRLSVRIIVANHSILTRRTCLCRKQFCYLCAAIWKTCDCPQWSEERLLEAAQERVAAREEDGPPVLIQVHARRVERAVEELIDNHECTHRSWRYVPGADQCQICHHTLNRFLFVSCLVLFEIFGDGKIFVFP